MRELRARCWLALGVLMVMGCTASHARANAQSYEIYESLGQIFWQAETQLQQRAGRFARNATPYESPLPPEDLLYQKYFSVNRTASNYLQRLEDAGNTTSWTIPHTLYLGGIAAFTIGDYDSAQKYFSRLLRDYPDYKRKQYISDNYSPDPLYSQPTKPALTKLLFYCQFVVHSISQRTPPVMAGHPNGAPNIPVILAASPSDIPAGFPSVIPGVPG